MGQFDQNTTAWLCTTASQIFFMQLGFLCYEVGFVQPVWTQSVILKNIEDTFVGVLTFLAFGFSLSESTHSFHGIIAKPTNPLLIGISSDMHDQILISAFFASTCATIISGAVLERMKNKAYIVWCLLTILVNYSFVSHWIWHPQGWLLSLGFVDGAGSIVVHSTAGMSALVAVWKLGGRKESADNDELKSHSCYRGPRAARPIIHAIGAFFLWYGWFAFNVASPIAYSKGIGGSIGDAIGTTALVTVISPIASSCAAFLWMGLGIIPLDFESLLNCLLSGLVSITGMCHTVNVHEALFVGAFSSVVYFTSIWVIRVKLHLDDPLQVIAIHLCCGVYSGIAEGIIANDTYGYPGLLHGDPVHFGVQLLGTTAVVVFNFVVSCAMWWILDSIIFRGEDIRVSILDIYLGTRLFDQNYDMALEEVLSCESNPGKKMLYQFHAYIADRYAEEQLDFLVVVKIFDNYLQSNTDDDFDAVKSAQFILQIIDTYVHENGPKCINVSGTHRSILKKIKKQLVFELKTDKITSPSTTPPPQVTIAKRSSISNHSHSLIKYQSGFYKSGMDITKENVFQAVYKSVWKIVVPHFAQFLKAAYKTDKHKFDVKIPFKLKDDWTIDWDNELVKSSKKFQLIDTIPQINDDGALLHKIKVETVDDARTSTIDAEGDTSNGVELTGINATEEEEYPIIFVDDNTKKQHEHDAAVVIE